MKILTLGSNKIRVEQAIATNKRSYYDEQGKEIPEEQVRILLAWLEAAPVVKEFVRKQPTAKKEFLDNVVREEVDVFLSKKEYSSAYKIIEKYCEENGADLLVKISSYVNQNGQYNAVSFLFKCINEQTQIFKATYESNDYTKEFTTLAKSNYDEFEAFCREKYQSNYFRIQN